MSAPFKRSRKGISVNLTDAERALLATIPELIVDGGNAGGRLDYQAHTADATTEASYQTLIGDSLDTARADDRTTLAATLEERVLDEDTALAWMRVVGDARIILAHRLGIDQDGWEETIDRASSDAVLISYLGFIQDSLVSALD